MKIAKLLELHQDHLGPMCHAGQLGDGYLLQKNSIYRQIRHKALAAKATFHENENPLYLAFSLGQLNTILSTKKIPYFNNVEALRILNSSLKTQLEWDEVIDGLKKNFVFHESCHLVARNVLGPLKTPLNPADQQKIIVQVLLEESFANACEALAIKDVTDPVHRCFYESNSYSVLIEERSNIQRAFHDFKPESFFLFMHLWFLASNFLTDQIQDKDFKRICLLSDLADFAEKNSKVLRSLSRISLTLDDRFKHVTTHLHLKLLGLEQPLLKLFQFDFLKTIETDVLLKENLKILAETATNPSPPSEMKDL